MGGQVEKTFEEYAKEGEQIPAEIAKVPLIGIIGAFGIITEGLSIPEVIEQALPPVEKKEEV
jgi:hypothetical protein